MFRKELPLQWIFFVVKPICKSAEPFQPLLGRKSPSPGFPLSGTG